MLTAIQRVRTDSANFYVSGLFTDGTGARRSFLGKASYSNGAMARYYVYAAGGTYNSDT
jgi:hypothetical protein